MVASRLRQRVFVPSCNTPTYQGATLSACRSVSHHSHGHLHMGAKLAKRSSLVSCPPLFKKVHERTLFYFHTKGIVAIARKVARMPNSAKRRLRISKNIQQYKLFLPTITIQNIRELKVSTTFTLL